METRTYFANSLRSAMEAAGTDLGPEAWLVACDTASEPETHLGKLRVTFAWSGVPSAAKGRKGAPPPERRPADIEEILSEISALRASIGPAPAAGRESTAQANPLRESLCRAGLSEEAADAVVSDAGTAAGRAEIGTVLHSRIKAAAFTPPARGDQKAVALVGPPGRGKTSTLIKIAVQYGIARGLPVRIVAAGPHGVGAREQLARFASILGVPFLVAETFDGLHLVLGGEKSAGLTLIDTPGNILAETEDRTPMESVLRRRPEIETHLVIRADATSADMRYMTSEFSRFPVHRLILTGLDEARSLSAAADLLIRSGLSVSLFGTGPRIPQDLTEASAAAIVDSVLAGLPGRQSLAVAACAVAA